MSVWITGDIHADPKRLGTKIFYEQKTFSGKKDEHTVIIAGDFGIVWDWKGETKNEKYLLNWLEEKPFTTVFVDGNHEDHQRLATYPVREWNGGKVHEIRPHVLHLMRGEIYTIEGETYFAFGGAASHDISDGILDGNDRNWKLKAKELREQERYMYRVKGISWWEEELPNQEEMENGLSNLERYHYRVDYMITHSPPASVLALLGRSSYKQDILTEYLENIKQRVEYKYWFMGHMHVNEKITNKDIILYEQIIKIH